MVQAADMERIVTQQTALSRQFALWADGIASELAFWDNWLATGGGQWPDDFQLRLDPRREMEPRLLHGLDATARILDVGAGPMTILGPCFQGSALDLVACDPLAAFYARSASRYGVRRPVPTRTGFAEDLSAFFPQDTFDLVYCRNALDHSFDPVRGIEEMLLVAKTLGRVVLVHSINEAETEKYQGLHQWNFTVEAGRFIIWNKQDRIDASARFQPFADMTIDTSRHGVVRLELRKKAAPDATADRYRGRIADILPALIDVLGDIATRDGARPG